MYSPFILLGLLFGGLGVGFFVNAFRDNGTFAEASIRFFTILAVCGGLLACVLVPLGLLVLIIYPFAQRGLLLQKLGIIDSIRHGWQVVRSNVGDVILLVIAFVIIGILFGIATVIVTLPFAFLAVGPFLLDLIRGNEINFGATEIVSLAIGAISLILVGAAVNSILTAYRSATVTLAYQQFAQKDGLQKDV